MHCKNILTLLIAFLIIPFAGISQVTTSSVSGTVKKTGGEPLAGGSIVLVHVPTGTTYRTAAGKEGNYNLVNLAPGGPYSITVTYVGYANYKEENVNLPLGENTKIDIELVTAETQLTEVTVVGTGGSRRKNGASTSIGKQQLATLPTLIRWCQQPF